MFGYIKPDMPNLYIKDSVLFKAMYCGLCKGIGCSCGTIPRFALSYDMAFLSALFHNIMNKDIEIKEEKCAAHLIVKRPMASRDDITESIACLNTFFTYYKLSDDIQDLHHGKFKRSFFKNGYNKALKKYPEIDKIIKDNYIKLTKLEKENCESLDIAADPFGIMIEQLSVKLLQEFSTKFTRNLCYNIGKWVYIIDALDDYDKDIKKKNYNPFYCAYKSDSFDTLLENNKKEIIFIFNSIFQSINDSLINIKFFFNHDLTDNILTKGLPVVTKKIMDKDNSKCKKIHTKF